MADNSDRSPRIGVRLRAARVASGLTLEQLAQATDLSKGFLSRLERDGTSPRLSTLMSICQALAIPPGSLFEPIEETLVRAEDALDLVPLVGDTPVERLLTPRTESAIQLIRARYPPNTGGGLELHTLDAEVEIVHVESGRLEMVFPTSKVHLDAGDTLTFRAREPHSWYNPDRKLTAEVLWVITPAPWGLRRRVIDPVPVSDTTAN